MIITIVSTQRTAVHARMKAVPANGTWPSIAKPSGPEDDQCRGDPAGDGGGQHERERSQPLGEELGVGTGIAGNVQPRLQGGHAA